VRVAALRPAAALEEDRARAQRVDADAVGPELAGERVGEVDLGRLRRGVLRRGWGFMPEIDAMSSAAPPPRARRCGRAARMSTAGWTTLRASVCSQSAAVVASSAGAAGGAAGVGHDEVQARSSRAHSSTGRGQRRLVGDVGATPWRPHAERAQLAGRSLHLLRVAGAQPHGAALVGQAQDDRPADPARRAVTKATLPASPRSITSWAAAGGGAATGGGRGRWRQPEAPPAGSAAARADRAGGTIFDDVLLSSSDSKMP
jgi:hypothetical protein